ncbi:DUF7144 family membrane protein [Amycolatopsis methanolica]|uniref:Integral membrane protein n=1 Tax=Amycolatopsis methanolica 239 TaxID=1068978 RepID=A0A076MXR7_AMYME|nr:hypothetical protein [Amycolatopsis methanolica]AIJ25864.1 integral membrane protein [Amycolatopsis methanolica 239]
MALADKISPAPREVRVAGALTVLPGIGLLVFGALLFASPGDSMPLTSVLAEGAFYVLFGLAVVGCAIGLLFGHTWARSPGLVMALITAGVGWYMAGPSGRPGFGVPIIVLGVAIIVLLFRQPARAWALGQHEGETEEEAAERGGMAGRRRERGEDD